MVYNNVFRDVGALSPYTHFRLIDPITLSGIAVAAGSALAGGANALSTNAANKRNIANQNELWEKEKAYQNWLNANGALIQKQSLQRAGFNPNSAFGTSANLQAPSPQKSDIQPTDFSFLSSAGSDVAHMIQQQPIIDAQVKNIEADTAKKSAETNNLNIDSLLKQTQNWSLRQKTPVEVKNIEKNTELLHEEMNRVKWDSKQIEANIELIKSKQANIDVDTSFLLDSYDTRLGMLTAAVSELQSRNALNIANAAVAFKSIEVMSHQIREIESRVSLNQKEWLYLDSQITNLCIDGDFKQFQYNIEKQFGKEKAKLILEQINEDILNTRSNMQWRPVGMMIGAVGAAAAVGNMLK